MSIAFSVDGNAIASKTSPPWTFPWDAGDGTAHRLAAVAKFSDGTETRASVETSRLMVNETEEVALVNVYAIARNAKGGYVTDLTASDFAVLENEHPQKVDRFSAERRPLRIAIVLDTSYSMEGDKLKAAIASAVEFLNVLQPGDEGLVIGFSDDVRIAQDLTSNKSEMEAAIRKVEAKGGTSLYDAIFQASGRLAEFEGRRVIVVLSDGRDEADNGLEPGSLHTLEEAQDRAVRNEVMVFAIGLGRSLARDSKALHENPTARAEDMDFFGRQPLVTILESLAQTTGGTAVFSPGAGQLRRSFEQIAEDLRHQYALAYRSEDKRHDGSWRAIKVIVSRPGVAVTNRKGYYAPSDGAAARSKAKLRP
jgi:Ca-activated chloride channel family protein